MRSVSHHHLTSTRGCRGPPMMCEPYPCNHYTSEHGVISRTPCTAGTSKDTQRRMYLEAGVLGNLLFLTLLQSEGRTKSAESKVCDTIAIPTKG
ncbi:hypothetical protein J6590_062781 [Homalodisca vitripennis]|nr:hypothetical protein J6590_062781 [Homalodisca vitripennis]